MPFQRHVGFNNDAGKIGRGVYGNRLHKHVSPELPELGIRHPRPCVEITSRDARAVSRESEKAETVTARNRLLASLPRTTPAKSSSAKSNIRTPSTLPFSSSYHSSSREMST